MDVDAFESNGLLGFGGAEEVMTGVEVQEREKMDEQMDENEHKGKGEGYQDLEAEAGPHRPTESLNTDDPFTSNGLLLNPSTPPSDHSIHNDIPADLGIGSSTTFQPQTPPRLTTRRPREPIIEPPLPAWRPPMEGRTSTGKVIQFPRRRRPIMSGENTARPSIGSLNLLDTPIHKLYQEIEEDKNLQAAQSLQDQFDRESRPTLTVKEQNARRQMWVDKYRPQKFTDLLGEERCQREVLGWLKEWDRCVFKKVLPGKKRPREGEENVYHDALGRPREKILLMSGPPGLGKTTLAHVVATQAGYKVLEVNASDERSGNTVTGRIQNAIDAGSGLASGGKPTCVIIDEIDGVGGGGDQSFVRSLLKLIQDTPAKKNGKQPAKVLRRPIICICNDLYATSLRQLRPFARIIRFKKAQSEIMVKRLRDICERESLSADARSLTTLVEITNADVRSCLNTLQFIKSKAGEVNEKMIRSSTVGLKDAGASINAVWAKLLVPMSAKKRRQVQGVADGKYVNRLAFEIQACGESDKIMQGCFEHYPNLKPLDTSLNNVNRIHDWIHFYDRLSHRVSSEQEFDLMGYMAYAVVPWHHHMAAPANAQIPVEYPKADYECFLTASTNKEVATALEHAIPASLRGSFTSSTVLTELAPMLMRIISPNLKPINANLVKADERAVLARLVDLMLSLNLHFEWDKTEDGQPMLTLEPPIDVFIHYDGKRATDIAASRFAVRQLVSQAMEAELARRRGHSNGAEGGKSVHGFFRQAAAAKGSSEPLDIADRPPVDFFGRLLATNPTLTTSSSVAGPPLKKFRVMYKFNEGSSSAVRKPIKMGALM